MYAIIATNVVKFRLMFPYVTCCFIEQPCRIGVFRMRILLLDMPPLMLLT